MRLLKFVVEGYRSFGRVEWAPGDLTVVTGAGAGDLMDAARLYAQLPRGWGLFGESMEAERARTPPPWRPEAVEFRLYARCAPHGDSELDFDHEVIVERLDGRPWWCIGYERTTLNNDFDDELVLDRTGNRVEYVPAKKSRPGTPIAQRPRSEVSHVAADMPVFGAMSGLQRDPRVSHHIASMATWSLHGALATEGMRRPTAPFGFAGSLCEDGSNFINLMANVCDWRDSRRRLDGAMRAALPGYDGLSFPTVGEMSMGMSLRTRDGRSTPHAELPDAWLHALGVYGMLLSPDPPALLWLDRPDRALDAWALPALADFALEAARSGRVVLSNPSEALSTRLDEVSRRPGTTRDRRTLSFVRYCAE